MVSATSELFVLIETGELDALRRALREQPNWAAVRNADGQSAVLFARYRSLTDALALLLAAGPELNIFEAAAVGDVAQVRALITDDPAWLDAYAPDGFWPLGLAAFFGHTEVAHLLLEQGAAVDLVAQNPMRVMALHAAVAGQHWEIVRLLVDRGAPMNARQQAGWTPLHAAAQHGDEAVVELLLTHGADPALANDDGQTPADTAASAGHPDLATLLRI